MYTYFVLQLLLASTKIILENKNIASNLIVVVYHFIFKSSTASSADVKHKYSFAFYTGIRNY